MARTAERVLELRDALEQCLRSIEQSVRAALQPLLHLRVRLVHSSRLTGVAHEPLGQRVVTSRDRLVAVTAH